MGKFSSLLSGCSSKSTSSMISSPASKSFKVAARQRTSASIAGETLRRVSRSESSFSRSLSWSDLIVEAVHSTTPRFRAADASFSTVAHVSSEERSKESVKTRLRTIDENAVRSVALDCSKRAGGIVCTTRRSPSPSSRASSGDTTVVLPPPINICFTSGTPECTAPTNSSTSCTCAFLSMMLCVNSNNRNLGSKRSRRSAATSSVASSRTKWR
mmetsp:Transcript_32907/g.76859  ORF Transcript_32907/g.76859 Transcript_32907/m.76859 type:complete len:214 (-) Transcript_32907:1982-2623(-)